MSTSLPAARSKGIPGLVVLVGIIVIGILTGSAYFQYKEPRLKAELAAQLADAPTSPEGRLAAWHKYGEPNIHHRLSDVGRFSEPWPWLITHAVQVGPGEIELWGVDCESIPHGVSHIEGLTVVVDLPAPSALLRTKSEGDFTSYVPVFASHAEAGDPVERLRTLARYLLEGMPDALAKDIEGASIKFVIAGDAGSAGE